MIGFNSVRKFLTDCSSTLETAPNEMQCDETISHMVTAGRSYFRTRRNACVTAGKIYHGCFEMLSWPHRTSNHIISICLWLLETCTKCSYFIEENMGPGAQRLAFEVKFEYIVHRSTNISWAGGLRLGKFQTTGVWSVGFMAPLAKKVPDPWAIV